MEENLPSPSQPQSQHTIPKSTPSNPPPKPFFSPQRVAIGLMVILLIVLITSAALVLLGQQNSMHQLQKAVKKQNEQKANASTTWKTYTNNDYGFSFQYPLLPIEDNDSTYQKILFFPDISPNSSDTFAVGLDYDHLQNDREGNKSFRLVMTITKNTAGFSMAQITKDPLMLLQAPSYDKHSYTVPKESIQPYKNGDINGITYYLSYDNGDQNAPSQTIVMLKDDYIYAFNYSSQGREAQKEAIQTIQKILSTFTFTNQKQATWKMYHNAAYNYSLKYPKDWTIEEITDTQESPENRTVTYLRKDYKYAKDSYQRFDISIHQVSNYDWFIRNSSSIYKKETINNYSVLRYTDSKGLTDSVIFKTSGNNYVSVVFSPYDEKKPHPYQTQAYEAFNQILSTFTLRQ